MHRRSQLALKQEAWRSRLMLLICLIGFVVLAGRAFYLQIILSDVLNAQWRSRAERVIVDTTPRSSIVDRNGSTLVESVPVYSVMANRDFINNDVESLKPLAKLLDVSESALEEMTAGNQFPISIRHDISPDRVSEVSATNTTGVFMKRSYERRITGGPAFVELNGVRHHLIRDNMRFLASPRRPIWPAYLVTSFPVSRSTSSNAATIARSFLPPRPTTSFFGTPLLRLPVDLAWRYMPMSG